eukprot:TRINITY_DN11392_c0_g1_i2.p1 TRINITY_DN11392_c0_g1~~TRINITY_DN11392_c0_g1_i2.p1  ORF type:complete len:382 (-),score=88.07 TRINITY_DN11392_c0_g1_i2:395-1540(-)
MMRRPPRSTQGVSSAASDVYKRQEYMGIIKEDEDEDEDKGKVINHSKYQMEQAAASIQLLLRKKWNLELLLLKKRKSKIQEKSKIIFICAKGYTICNRHIIMKMFYFSQIHKLKLSIFDVISRHTVDFLIDNFDYKNMSSEDFWISVESIIHKFEYNNETQEYFLGLEQDAFGSNDFGVTSTKLIDEKGIIQHQEVEQNCIFNQEKEQTTFKEIYKGTRKFKQWFFDIRVLLFSNYTIKFMVKKEIEDQNYNITEVKANMREYFALNGQTALTENKLGRKIYLWVNINEQNEIELNEKQLQDQIEKWRKQKKLKMLTKIQSRFRLCLAKRFFTDFVEVQHTRATLFAQFGLKIGAQYHYIKILRSKVQKEIFILRSDKAKK